MKLSKEIRFCLCVLAGAVLLSLLHLDNQRTALLRLEGSLQKDGTIPSIVGSRCSSLVTLRSNSEEEYVVEKLSKSTSKVSGIPRCTVAVDSSQHQRFRLQSEWLFAIRITSDRDGLLVQRKIPVTFPRPLCLLPFMILLLALLANIPLPRLGWLAGSYIFLLGGFNLIETCQTLTSTLVTTLTTEGSLPGFALIAIWLAIVKNQPNPDQQTPNAKFSDTLLHRFISFLCGVWNPPIFTAIGPLLYPIRTTLMRIRPFFDSQLVVAAVSLYLFSFDFGNPIVNVQKSLELPRYFSFSLFALYLIRFRGFEHYSRQLVWRLPNFWRALGFIAATEGVAWLIPPLRQWPTLTRIGVAVLISELIFPQKVIWKAAAKSSVAWIAAIIASYWLPTIASQCGVCELTLALSDPRLHPSTYVLFTFLGASITALVTGSFSLTLLTFFNILVNANHEPAVRAAFLDGVLAGSFLSPFSIYNLLPSVQFRLSMRELLSMRIRQLRYPLLMAALIYAVTIPAVMILRPLVFTFLCLVALTLELKRNHWTFRVAGTH